MMSPSTTTTPQSKPSYPSHSKNFFTKTHSWIEDYGIVYLVITCLDCYFFQKVLQYLVACTYKRSLCGFFFFIMCIKECIFWDIMWGTFFFPPYYNLLSKYLISTFLNHLLFNLNFMFVLNFDTIYLVEF